MTSRKPSSSTPKRKPLHPMRSFTRMETSNTNPLARSRAQTVQSYTTSELTHVDPIPVPFTKDEIDESHGPDLFEKQDSIETDVNGDAAHSEQPFAQNQGLDTASNELPVELASLTDRYLILTAYSFCLSLTISTLDSWSPLAPGSILLPRRSIKSLLYSKISMSRQIRTSQFTYPHLLRVSIVMLLLFPLVYRS
jgi:hypothetical protein